jgi:hypothetical protein
MCIRGWDVCITLCLYLYKRGASVCSGDKYSCLPTMSAIIIMLNITQYE